VQLQFVAPESFIAKGVEAKYLTALINHLLGVGVDLIGKLSLFLRVSFSESIATVAMSITEQEMILRGFRLLGRRICVAAISSIPFVPGNGTRLIFPAST